MKIEFSKIWKQLEQDIGPELSFNFSIFSISLLIEASKLSSSSLVKIDFSGYELTHLLGVFPEMLDDTLKVADLNDWKILLFGEVSTSGA